MKIIGIVAIANSIAAMPRRFVFRMAQVRTLIVTVREIVNTPGRRPGIGMSRGLVYVTVTCAAFALSGPVIIEAVTATGAAHGAAIEEPTLGILRN
jgi:uncharacterized membrane protein YczE